MQNNSHTGFTSDLYVSSHNITDNCSKIIEILCKSGVMGVVTPQKSVICNDQKCCICDKPAKFNKFGLCIFGY